MATRCSHQQSNTTSRQTRGLRMELLEDRCLLAINLVADINKTGAGGNPSQIAVVGDTAFFAGFDITRGTELWKTNGTMAGTTFVKDIYPGTTNGFPNSSEPRYLTNVNGTLFFAAFNPNQGHELWKSNGTAAGTVLVKDIWSGTDGGNPIFLTKSNGLLYFRAFEPLTGG